MALNLPRLVAPRFYAVHPSTGRPVSLGKVVFYAVGTNVLKAAFLNRDGTGAIGEAALDADGSCSVYLSGPYRIVVHDANGAVLYDADNINSIPVETPAGNPGSLIAANNLADLDDIPTARGILGLAKQASVSDATEGRVLLVGAGGLLGHAPEATGAGALDSILNIKWVRVTLANVALVGGPSGAPAGLCWTGAGADADRVQVYYPLSAGNPSPWRRTFVLGAWSAWKRDIDFGVGFTTNWTRLPDGTQICRRRNVTFTFSTANALSFTWTFPMPFTETPHVTVCVPNSGADAVGFGGTDMGICGASGDGNSVVVLIRRVTGAPDLVAGDVWTGVSLMAAGGWA